MTNDELIISDIKKSADTIKHYAIDTSGIGDYYYTPTSTSFPAYPMFITTTGTDPKAIFEEAKACFCPRYRELSIKNVIYNEPATIVFWGDGTKTVVKAKNEDFDPEKGLAMAIAKKTFGNKGAYYNQIRLWVDAYYDTKRGC